MHCNISANSRCSKFGDVINVSNNKAQLPVIDHHVLFEGNFLEDFDNILDEIAISTSIASSPSTMTHLDDEAKKPRACRDLRALIADDNRERGNVKRPGSREGLRERLESYLDVELQSHEEGSKVLEPVDKENINFNVMPNSKMKRFRSQRFKKTPITQKSKTEMYSPVVWVIEPGFNKDGVLQFKFTTDAGAFLILKDEEALSSIDIMKASSQTNTYFQVYSLEGKSSRVMKPDRVAQAVQEIITKSKPLPQEDDVLLFGAAETPKRGLRERFYRFLLRRRWKNLVRRQVRIAAGESRKYNRFDSLSAPLVEMWERMGRRNHSARI